MARPDLYTREWRELPRDGDCVVAFLFGEAVGPCSGLMHRHHVMPRSERSVQVCASHHPRLEAALRHLLEPTVRRRRCPHPPGTHRYPGAREACERRLNRRRDREPVAA